MARSRRGNEQQILAMLPDWVNRISQLNRLVADRLEVTASDLDCLHVLNTDGPATAAELASRVRLTPGAVSRMIDRLDEAGCITRTPDPDDRRRVLIAPTEDGLERVGSYYTGLTVRTQEDLAGFTSAELETIRCFVERSRRSTMTELGALTADRSQ